MGIDLSVYGRAKTIADYMNENQDRDLKKKLVQSQIDATAEKGSAFSLDKMGEQVLYKAAQGIPLSPEEMAIGKAYDAKHQSMYSDPSGNIVRKPPAFGSIGGAMGVRVPSAGIGGSMGLDEAAATQDMQGMGIDTAMPSDRVNPPAMPTADATPPVADDAIANSLRSTYEKQIAQAQGNPKLQQALQEKYGIMNLENAAAKPKLMPEGAVNNLIENNTNLRKARNASDLISPKSPQDPGDPDATGFKGYVPDALLQRFDPKGTETRAAIADLGSMVLHDRSGANVTASESPRLKPFIPSITDDPNTVRVKLAKFIENYTALNNDTTDAYRQQGYNVPDLSKQSKKSTPDAPALPDGISPADLAEYKKLRGMQ